MSSGAGGRLQQCAGSGGNRYGAAGIRDRNRRGTSGGESDAAAGIGKRLVQQCEKQNNGKAKDKAVGGNIRCFWHMEQKSSWFRSFTTGGFVLYWMWFMQVEFSERKEDHLIYEKDDFLEC